MYKFALEPVLNHRKYVEEILQKELGAHERLLSDAKKKLSAYKKTKMRFTGELEEKQRRGISISENGLYCHYFSCIAANIDKQAEKVSEIEEQFDRKRDDVIEAMKNRKTLDKLKEKGLKTYNRALMKDELDFINEVAIQRFSREKQSAGMREEK